MKYVISDTHFGHENIIEYTDRPFSTAREMDRVMAERWNETVSEDDVVYHLGDVSFIESGMTTDAWLEYLNGNILLVRGNHDHGVTDETLWVENCTIQYDKYRFFCTHKPPDQHLAGWTLHGHTHDNQPVVHPLVHPERQTVNVSAELLEYRPLSLDTLCEYLSDRTRYRDVADVA